MDLPPPPLSGRERGGLGPPMEPTGTTLFVAGHPPVQIGTPSPHACQSARIE